MTNADLPQLWATLLRFQRLALTLERAQTTALAQGIEPPASILTTAAIARSTLKAMAVELDAEQARQRFQARYPR